MRRQLEKEDFGETEQRILTASAEVFAQSGFSHGTVRQIAQRAGVNIAAINYYFGNKEQLYLCVVRRWLDMAFDKYSMDELYDTAIPVEQRLRIFIQNTLTMLLDDTVAPWFGKLFSREATMEPTEALQLMIDRGTGPASAALIAVVREMAGEGLGDEPLRRCAASVVAQCVFFYTNRPILNQLFQLPAFTLDNLAPLVEHIYQFSLAAIRALAQGK